MNTPPNYNHCLACKTRMVKQGQIAMPRYVVEAADGICQYCYGGRIAWPYGESYFDYEWVHCVELMGMSPEWLRIHLEMGEDAFQRACERREEKLQKEAA